MTPTIGFFHGWGFDAALWDAVIARLPGLDCRADDRGYFADPRAVPACTVAVTHSFGTMRVIAAPPAGCRAILAINGFDRFTAAAGFPGVPARVVERMAARLVAAPAEVLARFRAKCGASDPAPRPTPAGLERLVADLAALREADTRAVSRPPLFAFHAADDPIIPPAMQAAVLTGSEAEQLSHGGHLLPLTNPAHCASAIAAILARLTTGVQA